MALGDDTKIQLLLQLGYNPQQVAAIMQVFKSVRDTVKENERVEREANRALNIMLADTIQQRRKAGAEEKQRIKEYQDGIRAMMALEKQRADAERASLVSIEKEQQSAIREAIALRKQQADSQKQVLKQVEKDQQDAIRAELAERKQQAAQQAALLRQVEKEQQDALREAIALKKEQASQESALLRQVEKEQQDAIRQAIRDRKEQAKEETDQLKAIEQMQQDAIRKVIAARKQEAADQKALLRSIEQEQQRVLRDEIKGRQEAARQRQEEQKRQDSAARAGGLAGARSFVSLGFGTWAIPGLMQDQSILIDNILLGAGALEQVGAQMKGLQATAHAAGLSFTGMLVSMLPMLAIATAFSIAMKGFQDAFEYGKKLAEQRIALEKEWNALVERTPGRARGMTQSQLAIETSDTEFALVTKGQERKDAAAKLRELQQEFDRLVTVAAKTSDPIKGLTALFDQQTTKGQIEEQKKLVESLGVEYGKLSEQLRYNKQVLEAYVVDAERFARIMQGFQRDEDRIVRWGTWDRTATTDSTNEMLADNEVRGRANRKHRADLDLQMQFETDATKVQQLKDKIRQLDDEYEELTQDSEHLLNVTLNMADARQQEAEDIKKVQKAQEERNRNIEQTIDKVKQYSKEITDFQDEHALAVKRQAEEDAITAQRQGIEADFKRRIEQAKEKERQSDYAAKIQKIKDDAARIDREKAQDYELQKQRLGEKYNNRVDDINRKFTEDQLDALDKFHKAHKDKEDDYYKKRARLIEDAQDKLIELAANRDVAGFILEQKEFAKKLRRLDEDHKVEADQDALAYAAKAAEAQKNRDRDLEAARLDYELQLKQAQDAYEQDRAQRQQQLDERLKQEEEAFQIRIRRSEELERELQALREQWQIQDNLRRRQIEEEDYNTRLQIMKDKLREQQRALASYMAENAEIIRSGGANASTFKGSLEAVSGAQSSFTTYSPPAAAAQTTANAAQSYAPTTYRTLSTPSSVARINQSAVDSYLSRKYNENRFAAGNSYIPHDFFPMFADAGEAVLNKHDAAEWRMGRGSSGQNVFNISYYTRDLASMSDIQQASREMAGWIAQSVREIRR